MRLSELIHGDWLGVGPMALGLPAYLRAGGGARREWFGSALILDLTFLAVGSRLHHRASSPPIGRSSICGCCKRSVGGGFMRGRDRRGRYGSIFLVPVYCAQIPRYNASRSAPW